MVREATRCAVYKSQRSKTKIVCSYHTTLFHCCNQLELLRTLSSVQAALLEWDESHNKRVFKAASQLWIAYYCNGTETIVNSYNYG